MNMKDEKTRNKYTEVTPSNQKHKPSHRPPLQSLKPPVTAASTAASTTTTPLDKKSQTSNIDTKTRTTSDNATTNTKSETAGDVKGNVEGIGGGEGDTTAPVKKWHILKLPSHLIINWENARAGGQFLTTKQKHPAGVPIITDVPIVWCGADRRLMGKVGTMADQELEKKRMQSELPLVQKEENDRAARTSPFGGPGGKPTNPSNTPVDDARVERVEMAYLEMIREFRTPERVLRALKNESLDDEILQGVASLSQDFPCEISTEPTLGRLGKTASKDQSTDDKGTSVNPYQTASVSNASNASVTGNNIPLSPLSDLKNEDVIREVKEYLDVYLLVSHSMFTGQENGFGWYRLASLCQKKEKSQTGDGNCIMLFMNSIITVVPIRDMEEGEDICLIETENPSMYFSTRIPPVLRDLHKLNVIDQPTLTRYLSLVTLIRKNHQSILKNDQNGSTVKKSTEFLIFSKCLSELFKFFKSLEQRTRSSSYFYVLIQSICPFIFKHGFKDLQLNPLVDFFDIQSHLTENQLDELYPGRSDDYYGRFHWRLIHLILFTLQNPTCVDWTPPPATDPWKEIYDETVMKKDNLIVFDYLNLLGDTIIHQDVILDNILLDSSSTFLCHFMKSSMSDVVADYTQAKNSDDLKAKTPLSSLYDTYNKMVDYTSRPSVERVADKETRFLNQKDQQEIDEANRHLKQKKKREKKKKAKSTKKKDSDGKDGEPLLSKSK